ILTVCTVVVSGCQFGPVVSNPSPTPSVSSSPSPSQSNTQLPQDWEWLEDAILGFRIGYPQNWYAAAAGAEVGEATVYSFNTAQTADRGGVPNTELKVGITRFDTSDPQRQFTLDESQVIEEE